MKNPFKPSFGVFGLLLVLAVTALSACGSAASSTGGVPPATALTPTARVSTSAGRAIYVGTITLNGVVSGSAPFTVTEDGSNCGDFKDVLSDSRQLPPAPDPYYQPADSTLLIAGKDIGWDFQFSGITDTFHGAGNYTNADLGTTALLINGGLAQALAPTSSFKATAHSDGSGTVTFHDLILAGGPRTATPDIAVSGSLTWSCHS
jgi:hypothetical protein